MGSNQTILIMMMASSFAFLVHGADREVSPVSSDGGSVGPSAKSPMFDDWVMVEHPQGPKSSPIAKEVQRVRSTSPKRSTSLPKFTIRDVGVLQQKTNAAWLLHGKNIEEANGGAIFDHPELKWKNVRMEDGTNCAYHSLKNLQILLSALNNPSINVDVELGKSGSLLNQQLKSLDELLQRIPQWTVHVYDDRKAKIAAALRRKGQNMPASDADLKSIRATLPETLRPFVNANDGHIKTEDLDGSEVEKLMQLEPDLKNHIIVLEYTPGLPVEAILTEQMKAQIESFKASRDARLGIVWNEEGFHHWVAYFADKRNGHVTLYKMNSTGHKQPVHESQLLALLTGQA